MFRYALNGMLVESDRALSTLAPEPSPECPAHAAEAAAIKIRWLGADTNDEQFALRPDDELCLEVPVSPLDSPIFLRAYRGSDRYLLQFAHGTCFVANAAGDGIRCMDSAGLSERALEHLFIDQVLPKVIQLRGDLCLHASAVELNAGEATAILGCSGDGKSTLCGVLTRSGAALLADDALALQFGDATIEAFRGYGSLRLLPDSAAALSDGPLPRVSERTTKRRLTRRLAAGRLRLSRIVLLAPGSELALEPVRPAESATLLPKFVHRLDPMRPDLLANEFQQLMELAATVPVYRLHFRHRFEEIDEVACLLQQE